MSAFGPYYRYADSDTGYVAMRRRRRWAMGGRQGLQGYAAYLMGADAGGADAGAETSAIMGAEIGAYEDQGNSALRSIAIGAATGVVTFLLNRWLSKVLK